MSIKRFGASLIEAIAAALVVVEVVVLFAGVVSRYVFHNPLTWTDELASILFLWLAMLGGVVALQRAEHMRLGAVAGVVPERVRRWFDAFAAAIMLAFLLGILMPAWRYARAQWFITTTALEIHDTFRVAAIGVGAVLMSLIALSRLLARARRLEGIVAALGVGAIAVLLFLLHPFLPSLGNLNLLIFFLGVVGFCLVIGVPIAFSFGIATLAYLASSTHVPLQIVVTRMDEGMSTLILLAVPLFVFLGLLIDMTGLARALVGFIAALLGHVRGGLAYVLLAAMYLVSGISGSKAADMAAVAPVLFPEMKKRGARPGELVAMLSSSGAMAETIPPSLVLITIGSVTGVSIADLFNGGLLPAFIGAIALVIVAFFRSRGEDLSQVVRARGREVARAFLLALPALVLPILIRVTVTSGAVTATEVSVIGIVYTIIAGLLFYRRFDWRALPGILYETVSLSGAILFIIGTATAMAWAFTQSGFSVRLVQAMAAMPGGKAGFLAVSILAFIVLGSVLEGIPAIVLFGPLLFPVARAIGVHEVHYAMVVILAMGLGLFAPPLGLGFYAACAIGRVSPDEAMGRVWPYLGALFLALIIIAVFPWLSIGFL
ncbi:MAG TPA: TRAP transporter large permease subunit [Stellaceae bacterium]|nr:TRAP transporter large permease subunit [Stellaceae bacterium]